MAGFGSEENPYIESFTGRIVEVGWGVVKAVKWKKDAILHDDGAFLIPSSAIGTLSVWLNFRERSTDDIFSAGWFLLECGQNWFQVQPTGWTDQFPISMPTVSTRLWLWEAEDNPGEPGRRHAAITDTAANIEEYNKFYHLYMEWDTDAGTALIKINGVTVANYVWAGDVYLTETFQGPPFAADWPNSSNEGPSRTQLFSDSFRAITDSPFSIADFWFDVTHTSVGVEKFINLETGKPRGLGEFGEKPITPAPTKAVPNPPPVKPALFFHRSGEPETFLENRGYAGEFVLVGDDPEAEPIDPSFEVVP